MQAEDEGEGTNDKIQRGTGDLLNRLQKLDDQKKELRRRECRMRKDDVDK
jgi:hypothetical protein